jgi:hypothetical protein
MSQCADSRCCAVANRQAPFAEGAQVTSSQGTTKPNIGDARSKRATDVLIGYRPEVFTSESIEVLSPLDLRRGYIIELNGHDYSFTGWNSQVIFVRTYNDPDLMGPPRNVVEEGVCWYDVEALHVY